MGGGAPSVDASGNLYVITGNGNFDVTNSTAPNNDYGDSFLQLTSSLAVSQYFTPADQATDNSSDGDFGSGGTSVIVDLPTNGTLANHLVIGGGEGRQLMPTEPRCARRIQRHESRRSSNAEFR